MKNNGQLLIEIVFSLGILSLILIIIVSFVNLFVQVQRYQNFNQGIALTGFEKYRNALFDISITDWNKIQNLSSNVDYFIYATSDLWVISTGTEQKYVGNELYEFSFQIGDYTTSTLKFVTVTAKYSNSVFQDYFLLPKLNINTSSY